MFSTVESTRLDGLVMNFKGESKFSRKACSARKVKSMGLIIISIPEA